MPIFLLLWVLPCAEAWAQGITTYGDQVPGLKCSKAFYGSEVKIELTGAPPNTVVLRTFELISEEIDASPEKTFLVDTMMADHQGRLFFPFRIDDEALVGRSILIRVEWPDPKAPEKRVVLARRFRVESPELLLPSMAPDAGGIINKLDELSGDLTEIHGFEGMPEKITIRADAKIGFAIMEGGRIAVFDNVSDKLIRVLPVGFGLSEVKVPDVAVTPDGRKMIALTTLGDADDGTLALPGSLGIYDADTLDLLHWCAVDGVPPGGSGDLLAVSEDSTLVYIRQEDMTIGQYNLLTGEFLRFQVGDLNHFGGELRDIKILGNCVMALVVLPDHQACLHLVNCQNYQDHCIPVGIDPQEIKVFRPAAGRPMAAVLDRADDGGDVIWLVDVFSNFPHQRISLPDGAVDFDITGSRNLCMILYNGAGGNEGLVRFFDLETFEVLNRTVTFPLQGEGRAYLSRSRQVNLGYVYSEAGTITQIDLDRFTVEEQIEVRGTCSGRAVEVPCCAVTVFH